MTENEQKQQFSIAYIQAVAARAGYACQANLVDDDSVDVTLAASGWVHNTVVLRSPRLEVQLKATAQNILRPDHLAFPLPLKNYNDLRMLDGTPFTRGSCRRISRSGWSKQKIKWSAGVVPTGFPCSISLKWSIRRP